MDCKSLRASLELGTEMKERVPMSLTSVLFCVMSAIFLFSYDYIFPGIFFLEYTISIYFKDKSLVSKYVVGLSVEI